MPPLPINAKISSWVNSFASSSTEGGWNAGISLCVPVSVEPCLRRQAGQGPSTPPAGSVAPHCGHFFSMPGLAAASFIHASQKQSCQNVTQNLSWTLRSLAAGTPVETPLYVTSVRLATVRSIVHNERCQGFAPCKLSLRVHANRFGLIVGTQCSTLEFWYEPSNGAATHLLYFCDVGGHAGDRVSYQGFHR